jgi:hypothetical protein
VLSNIDKSRRHRYLLIIVVTVQFLYILKPSDVVSPIDPWQIGHVVLHGKIPYHDFLFEYPPLAIVPMLITNLFPRGWAFHVLALQAVVLEVLLYRLIFIERDQDDKDKFLLLLLILFPLLSGGFDAYPMAAIAISAYLFAKHEMGAYVVAGLGTLIKLSPAQFWISARRVSKASVLVGVITLACLIVPILNTHRGDSDYVRYSIHRGVEVESVAGSTHWISQKITGGSAEFHYRFRTGQYNHANVAAAFWLALSVIGLLVVLLKPQFDIWKRSFLVVLLLLVGFKVLSPQFIVWLIPVAALLGGADFLIYLAIAVLTIASVGLSKADNLFFGVIALRNALLVYLAAVNLLTQLKSEKSAISSR